MSVIIKPSMQLSIPMGPKELNINTIGSVVSFLVMIDVNFHFDRSAAESKGTVAFRRLLTINPSPTRPILPILRGYVFKTA